MIFRHQHEAGRGGPLVESPLGPWEEAATRATFLIDDAEATSSTFSS